MDFLHSLLEDTSPVITHYLEENKEILSYIDSMLNS